MEGIPHLVEEEKDLKIETADGLQSFLEYIQSDYQFLKEADALSDHLEEVHQRLQNMIARCLKLLEEGGGVSDDVVSEMQSLYDEIDAAAELLQKAELETAKAEEITGSEHIIEADVVANDNEQPEVVTEERVTTLYTKAADLIEASKELLTEYATPVEKFNESDANVPGYLYDELKTSANRAETILQALKSLKEKDPTEINSLTLDRYQDQLEEIEKNLEQLEAGLVDTLSRQGLLQSTEVTKRPSTGKLAVSLAEHGASTVSISTPPPKPKIFAVPDEPARTIQHSVMVPKPRQEAIFKSPFSTHLASSVRDPKYRQFVNDHFPSSIDLEKVFHEDVKKIERPSRFESMLSEKTESAFFAFLIGMKISDVDVFNRLKWEEKKAACEKANIVYEDFHNWMHHYDKMKKRVRTNPAMTFGELFVRSELEEFMEVAEK